MKRKGVAPSHSHANQALGAKRMERIEKTVFISYRRTNIPWALAIFQYLHHHGYDVFFDYDGIASGDFEGVILGNITARAHFLVLLTPSALERCAEPTDWLRREIETALHSRRNIVPLMLEGFDFGSPKIASQLTGKLATLKSYNGLSIPPEYFLEAMGRLRERYLNVPLTAVLHPASPSAQAAASEQQAAAHAAPPVREEELTAQQWYERGLGAADVDERLRFYSEAIRLEPDYAEALNNRANARCDKGDREGGLRDFTDAIRLEPGEAMYFFNRGALLDEMGNPEGALKDYTEAIRLESKYYDAFFNRGSVRHEKGDLEGALNDFNTAASLKSDDATVFICRGDLLRDQGDHYGALKDYTKAIRLKRDNASVFNSRGAVRHAVGVMRGALKDYNEAIRLSPEYGEAFYNRSITLGAMGDHKHAGEDLDEALRLGFKPKA